MTRKVVKFLLLWFLLGVLPTVILFFLLIITYNPLNGYPVDGFNRNYFFARGELLEKESNHGLMTFEKSSTFWDTSKVAPLGAKLTLLNIVNQTDALPGERLIIKGTRVGFLGQGQIDQVTIYKNHFQPLGVDWREGVLMVLLALSVFSWIIYKWGLRSQITRR